MLSFESKWQGKDSLETEERSCEMSVIRTAVRWRGE